MLNLALFAGYLLVFGCLIWILPVASGYCAVTWFRACLGLGLKFVGLLACGLLFVCLLVVGSCCCASLITIIVDSLCVCF